MITGEDPTQYEGYGIPTRRPNERILLYLSGSVKKGASDSRAESSFWTDDHEREIVAGIRELSVQLLNPSKSVLRRSDYYANFGCDLHLVSISDLVLVDAREKRGIGIGAEMLFAQTHGIPVLTICPPNSDYRRDFVPDVFGENLIDWIHPFIHGLSDYIVDDLRDAVELINKLIANGRLTRHQSRRLEDAMSYYQREREAIERGSAD